MVDIALLTALLGAVMFLCAWREMRHDNRRDAALLAGFGGAATLAGAAAWLL
jgi:hypothetical protein